MRSVSADLLEAIRWECASTPPAAVTDVSVLEAAQLEWLPAQVPGTAAGAMQQAGRWSWGRDDAKLLDGRDWWFRARFPGVDSQTASSPRPWELCLGGLATLADVWLNGVHVLYSEDMFLAHRLEVDAPASRNELVIRLAALQPRLRKRHPRPRWKTRLVRDQSLRWYRTTMLGRGPAWSRWGAPVGPWRPVTLTPVDSQPAVLGRRLRATCVGAGAGTVAVEAEVRMPGELPSTATLRVSDRHTVVPVESPAVDGQVLIRGTIELAAVERWWPHTHGAQPLYPVELDIAGARLDLGRVGFRTVELDRQAGAFTISINGESVFCRGACWGSPDPVGLTPAEGAVRASLLCARKAGLNMMRNTGYTWYEDATFWDACDELGILVWQDCMLASVDPPEAPEFVELLQRELRQAFALSAGRPSLAIVCGSSEIHQQPALLGLAPERWRSSVLEQAIPAIVDEVLPDVPYVPSTPTGGEVPTDPDVGVAHYFGVGAYLRPLTDARMAGVRFAAECLSFATPPERETVREVFGGAHVAGHDSRWKATVARDSATSWDFEDVRDHYVGTLFGVEALEVRVADPDRALDLGRAAVAEAVSHVLTEWRRGASTCAGAIVLTWRDLWPGAGWGLVDSLGRPKSSWYACRRALASRAVLVSDEGLSGLRLHVHNDRPETLRGRLRLTVFALTGQVLERGKQDIEVAPRRELVLGTQGLLGGFRDLNYAYRFAAPSVDVVAVELEDEAGGLLGEAVHLPLGPARPRLPAVGLRAQCEQAPDGTWRLEIATDLLAQYVSIEVPGYVPADSWFHLAPGRSRRVALSGGDGEHPPDGTVRALNAIQDAAVLSVART